MDTCLMFLFLLSALMVKGVCGDEVKSVSVMEGDCVTLHTDVIKEKDDLIVWTLNGPKNTFLAVINGEVSSLMLSDDERFRNKLKINNETGDLTISDITTQLSGEYKLKISRNNRVSYQRFNVTVRSVFNDEVKSVSVMKGLPLILYTHELEESDDVMEWRFGPEHTLVAEVNGNATIRLSDDERFRDRVKVDNQTGDLMINDITSHHSGLYTLKIRSNNKVLYKTFDVAVHAETSFHFRSYWIIPVVLLICCCIAGIGGFIYLHRRNGMKGSEQDQCKGVAFRDLVCVTGSGVEERDS